MITKRVLVLGIALILLAMVAGVVFAASEKEGVYWVFVEGRSPRLESWQQYDKFYMEIYNSNDYAVEIWLNGTAPNHIDKMKAGETRHLNATSWASVRSVVKTY